MISTGSLLRNKLSLVITILRHVPLRKSNRQQLCRMGLTGFEPVAKPFKFV
jgi:hypothetical protein